MLQVRGLSVELLGERTILSGMDFEAAPGEIVGLFGESGCGKTTLALALLGLLPSNYRISGSVRLEGRELVGLGEREFQRIRGARVSVVFQDPLLSLNPALRIDRQLREVARAHSVEANAAALLSLAGLPDSARILRSWPHQLSGGERQRVVIAQALVCRPPLIIADEPFTALDPPRVLELAALFRRLKDDTGCGFLLISHSPGVLARIADRVLVLNAGRIVEQGPPGRLFRSPEHPYTAAVVAAAQGIGSGA